jgi:hypothetical protein
MIPSRTLVQSLLIGAAQAATISRRWVNGDLPTGTTDPDVSRNCYYWANEITAPDTCEALASYFGVTIPQLASWVGISSTPGIAMFANSLISESIPLYW